MQWLRTSSKQFQILIIPPELDMHWQVRLPATLAVIHNFIGDQDPMDPEPGARAGELAQGVPRVAERDQANQRQD